MNSNRAILLTVVLLALTVAIFEVSALDLIVQDRFYDAAHGWRVDREAPVAKMIFYDAPTLIFHVIVAFLFLVVAIPASRAARTPIARRDAAFLLACVVLIPFTVGALKKTTGVFGPYQVERYGGVQPYRTLFQSIPDVAERPRGRGYPAGHCSGGFALMSLYFVGKRQRTRWLGLCCGLATGWIVGTYQILKGAHYLSHTVVTMVLAWLIVQLLARAFGVEAHAVGA